ncbi:UbiD family decarboxylase [Maricurvus nonylphenolicus]|uniref:UbiD family decarboxylase n=1 Tax=Maricurvus nonylphenolicus TaxID=1008307 RepID=UPI0036F43A8A
MTCDIVDLRTALAFLEEQGDSILKHEDSISPEYEVAKHYVNNSAGVPASSISREEQMVMYTNVVGHDMSVLMGVFGSRERNQRMLTGNAECHHGAFMKALGQRIPPVTVPNPPCQEIVIDADIDLLKQLPVLTLTPNDAGPYITLGFVLAKYPDSDNYNASVHRLCIHGKDRMTISIYPGNHLGNLYQAAMERGESLPVSINIGLDPAIYYASSLTEPVCGKGESELDIVGGLRGKAVNLSDCLHVDAKCISHAEIVLEAELTAEQMPENYTNPEKGSMPELLGYQGQVAPIGVPVVKVKAITHRQNPIYQTVIGPGMEQSELTSITPEIATRGILMGNFDLDVRKIHYSAAGGGVLMAALQINKQRPEDDELAVKAAMAVLSTIPPLKHIFIVDTDVDPQSPDDLFWALTTRYQADQDMHTLNTDKLFPMDPTQSQAYRSDNPGSMKALFDCTSPYDLKDTFKRAFV